jgi:hypothetical protein
MALPNYYALLRPLRDGVRGNVYQLCMLPPPQLYRTRLSGQ